MKKLILLTIFLILTSFTSAEIIINQQPKEIYNMGDAVSVPITITTISGVSKIFQMDLLCQERTINFYKNGISLSPGEEKLIDSSLILTKELIGEMTGTCKIKGSLGQDYVITNEFEISDLIMIQSKVEQVEFEPGQTVLIKGNAYKQNGQDVKGFIKLDILSSTNEADNINQVGTIHNGFFSINITFPKNLKAGAYLVNLEAYEQDESGLKTNKGFMNYNILIKQIPTSLEIVFGNLEVLPKETLKVKTILHDQTGEKIIPSTSIITLKKANNEIVLQTEQSTEEYLEYTIDYKESPSEWIVVAVSNKLTSEANFKILENKEIEVSVVNRTIEIKNTGNVPYIDSALITIGNGTLKVNLTLPVNGIQKFELTAPNGEYQLEVMSNGEKKLSTSVSLTGKSIDIREIKEGGFKSAIRHYPLAFIFILLVLALFGFLLWKKGLKKLLKGGFKKKATNVNTAWEKREIPKEGALIKSSNIAILSLSMKGEKQPATIVCLRIKNLKEVDEKDKSVQETFRKINNFAESKKAFLYKNQENIIFILTPSKTRTFQNELPAFEIAKKIKEVLSYHNQIFKQKIDFGISLNYGNIIAKSESKDNLIFMGLESLLILGKKLASLSVGEIFLSKEVKDKLKDYIKPKEHKHESLAYYTVGEMRNSVDNSKFLSGFVKRNPMSGNSGMPKK